MGEKEAGHLFKKGLQRVHKVIRTGNLVSTLVLLTAATVILVSHAASAQPTAPLEETLQHNPWLKIDETKVPSGGFADYTFDVQRSRAGYVVSIDANPPLSLRYSDDTASPTTRLASFLGILGEDIGIAAPSETLFFEPTKQDKRGITHARGYQRIGEFRVLGSEVAARLTQGALLHFSARWLIDPYITKSLFTLDLHESEMFQLGFATYGEAFRGVGIFHGTVFGLPDWERREPALAFVAVVDTTSGSQIQYIDAWSGEILHSQRDQFGVFVDQWGSVSNWVQCLINVAGSCNPASPVKLQTQGTCGLGIYPNCTLSASQLTLWSEVQELVGFLDDSLSRDSWDDGNMVDCAAPGADPSHCCNLPTNGPYEPHALNVAGPVNYFGAGSKYLPSTCHAIIATTASCPSAVAHEFAHGIDHSEKALLMDGIGTIFQPDAMGAGFADIIGVSFKHTHYPNLGTPWVVNDEYSYCTPARNISSPTASDADHASQIIAESMKSDQNSLAFSYGFYLLAREPSLGSLTHYGVSITGIGLAKALNIYYSAMTQYITSTTPRSFSHMRTALMTAAGSIYGYSSTEYFATQSAVDAMGYWTTPSSLPQRFASRPEVGRVGTSGSSVLTRRVVVYQDGTTLKYRYRYFSNLMYYWSSPISIAACTGAFQAFSVSSTNGVDIIYKTHILYQDTNNYLRHAVLGWSGVLSDVQVLLNGANIRLRTNSDIRVIKQGSLYKLFARDYSSDIVYMRPLDLGTSTVDAGINTGVAGSSRFEAGSDGTSILIFKWDGPGTSLEIRKRSGSTFYELFSTDSPIGDYTIFGEFDVASYKNAIHVVLDNAYNDDNENQGLVYLRCDSDCEDFEDWSRVGPINTDFPDDDPLSVVSLGTDFLAEGGLTLARQRANSTTSMTFQTKFSN